MRGNHWLLLFFTGSLCLVMPILADFVRCLSPEADMVSLMQQTGFCGANGQNKACDMRCVRFVNDLEQFDNGDGSLALIEKTCNVNGHQLGSGEQKDLYVQGNYCSITIVLRPGIANALSGSGSFLMRLLSAFERICIRKRKFIFNCVVPEECSELTIAAPFIAACAYAEAAGSEALSYWVKPTLELEVSLVPPVEM
jgi:hypothetical protein